MQVFNQQSATAAFGVIIPLAAGFLLRDVKAVAALVTGKAKKAFERQRNDLKQQQETLQDGNAWLAKKEKEVSDRDAALIAREKKLADLEERELALNKREAALLKKEKTLDERENALGEREAKLLELEKRESALEKRESALNDKESNLLEREKRLDEKESTTGDTVPELTPAEEEAPTGGSEKEKRIKMIKEELQKIIQQVQQEELEDEMETEAVEALEKAALTVCYLKKYYDCIKDELIYFPSVSSTIVSYTLMEEAGKYWQEVYEDEEEFPMEYSVAMRSVVTMNMAGDDDGIDEEYMSKLALDVEI